MLDTAKAVGSVREIRDRPFLSSKALGRTAEQPPLEPLKGRAAHPGEAGPDHTLR